MVTNSLASVQGIDGALYLEKIVQLPIELPPPPQSLLDNHLQQQLMSFIDMFPTHRIEGEERSRLATVYQSLVLPNITTLRKLKRYLNKLNVTVQVLGEEVCPTDVFGMVVLALFYKNTYEWIWKNRLELCDEALHFNREDNTWKIKLAESPSSAIDLDHSNVEMTVKGIGALYPAAARWSRPNVLVTRKISRETGRIASIDNTEYFYGSIEVGSITRRSLERLVFANNGDELGNGLIRLEQTDEMDRALDYIEVNRARLSFERKEQVAGQMLKVVGSISQDDDVSFFQTPHPRKFARIICSLLTDLGIKRSDAIVLNAVDGFTTLDYVGLT